MLGDRRPLRYGDMLVLVRRRGNAFDAVIQALKHASIPVAGADRLKLTEHIAIIDLMNLADALLLPQDDLALAVALKSPLFGLDDDDLFKLAWQRKGSLRRALDRSCRERRQVRGGAATVCDDCEARAATPRRRLRSMRGCSAATAAAQRILRRLGHEANDALDEFLELALGYERKAPASLQGFMAWLRAADTEVKRDMEISRDEVRVMTVHGAKGLEASVVFLVDTTTSPTDTQRLRLIHVPRRKAPGAPGVVVWAGRKADDPPVVAAARAAMLDETEDEYRRLLYVAMTRAADRLIVGGCMPGNMNNVRKRSWYDLIAKGLAQFRIAGAADSRRRPARSSAIRGRRMRPPAAGAAAPRRTTAPIALPSWLRTQAAPEAPADSLLRPSDPVDGRRLIGVRTGESVALRARAPCSAARWCTGCCNRCPTSRPSAAATPRWATSPATPSGWTDGEREALARAVLALIEDPPFRAGIRGRQPRRGVDRRTAGAAGRAPALVSGPDRPAGGDAGARS